MNKRIRLIVCLAGLGLVILFLILQIVCVAQRNADGLGVFYRLNEALIVIVAFILWMPLFARFMKWPYGARIALLVGVILLPEILHLIYSGILDSMEARTVSDLILIIIIAFLYEILSGAITALLWLAAAYGLRVFKVKRERGRGKHSSRAAFSKSESQGAASDSYLEAHKQVR